MNAVDRAVKMFEASGEERLKKRPPNAFTFREYVERTGLSRRTAQNHISKLVDEEKIKRVRFPQRNRDGRIVMQTGYQLV